MEIITIKTLVDITNSGVNRPKQGAEKEFNQHRNWITLLQCIGLRSIIEYQYNPSVEMLDLKDLNFGKKHKGKHKVWTFEFTTDRNSPFASDAGPLELLINDLHQVPVLEKLDETINMTKAVFDLNDDAYKNTIIDTRIENTEEQ